MNQLRKLAELSESLIEATTKLLFDLCEVHADEVANGHDGDEEADGCNKCSYCEDMETAAKVLVACGMPEAFTYPDNWPEGKQVGTLRSV